MPLVYCYCASVASIHTNPTTTWCISRVLPGLSSAASSIALLALHVHVYASLPDSDKLTYGRLLGRLCEPYITARLKYYCISKKNSIKLRDVMQGTTFWLVGRRNGPLFDLKNRPLFDPKYRPLFDPKNRSMLVSAVAEVDDRLIAEWDRSQNRTAAPLLEHGITILFNQKTACRSMFGRATSRATVP